MSGSGQNPDEKASGENQDEHQRQKQRRSQKGIAFRRARRMRAVRVWAMVGQFRFQSARGTKSQRPMRGKGCGLNLRCEPPR